MDTRDFLTRLRDDGWQGWDSPFGMGNCSKDGMYLLLTDGLVILSKGPFWTQSENKVWEENQDEFTRDLFSFDKLYKQMEDWK
jgi:hypothetical protein